MARCASSPVFRPVFLGAPCAATCTASTTACSRPRPAAPAAGWPTHARPAGYERGSGNPASSGAPHGAGWALVGDAGSFLDPLSTHGITDALRDAEMLARSVAESRGTLGDALSRYADERDRVVGAFFDVVDRLAGYGWDLAQVRRYLLELSAAMSEEADLIAASTRSRSPG